jgi:phage shock protein C
VTDQPLEPGERPAPEQAETQELPKQERVEPQSAPEPEPEPAPEPEPERAPEPTAWPAPERRLWRSRDDRVIAGVCGGLGRYLGVDPVLVRIAAVVLVFAGGAGILLYAIGWIVMPEEPELVAGQPVAGTEPPERTSGAVLLGFVFVVLGAFFLVDELWPDFLSWQYVWPVALIAVGLAILLRSKS